MHFGPWTTKVAIEKAIEIISSGAVAGNAAKHLPTMLQKSSFAQMRSDSGTKTQARVALYLNAQAKKLNSRVLSALATHAADDPFQKVTSGFGETVFDAQYAMRSDPGVVHHCAAQIPYTMCSGTRF